MFSRIRPARRLTTDIYRCNNVSQRGKSIERLRCLSTATKTLNLKLDPLSTMNLAQPASRTSRQEQFSTQTSSESEDLVIKSDETFASLIRHSAFVQMGNPVGKVNAVSFPDACAYSQ